MNRQNQQRQQQHSQSPVTSYRTVTEISNGEDAYYNTFEVDITKNVAYMREAERREMYITIATYIAMVHNLKVSDLRSVFSATNNDEDLINLVYNSLGFVNAQVFPHSTRFVDMNFVVTNKREMSAPGEPIVFYRNISLNDDQTVVCYVDKPSILRILEKPIDVNAKFEEEDCNSTMVTRLLDKIKSTTPINSGLLATQTMMLGEYTRNTTQLDETYVTQFVTLLILFTNAFLGYYKLIRTDFQQYFTYLTNHDSLASNTFVTNLQNLFLSKFKFSVEGDYDKRCGPNTSNFVFKRLN